MTVTPRPKGTSRRPASSPGRDRSQQMTTPKVEKSNAEWREELTPEQYRVLREQGTERAFAGKYWNVKEDGMYHCAGCGAALFSSETKFDSGTGWPSFYEPSVAENVETDTDTTHGMVR